MKNHLKNFIAAIILLFVLIVFAAGCKTPPPAPAPEPEPPKPYASLRFNSPEAKEPTLINLGFTLEVFNPRSEIIGFVIDEWATVVNGARVSPGSSIKMTVPGPNAAKYAFNVAPGTEVSPGTAKIPIGLELDVNSLNTAGVQLKDDFTVVLTLNLIYNSSPNTPARIQVTETAVFPYIREPVFSITAIAILKAELINTRFRVTMQIDNPNIFPVDLSSFNYELFGNGLLWADGSERNILSVPAKTSIRANLFLLMNFINMKRDLLDQIIRLEDVNYRFAGDVLVNTGIEYLPRFKSEFDLSGYSQVLEN